MAIIERHTSPDGLLDLVVDLTAGDWTVGFTQGTWHTHGDILAALDGGTPRAAVRKFVDEILTSQRVIALSRTGGEIRDVWVASEPKADEAKYASGGEATEKRFWSGERVA